MSPIKFVGRKGATMKNFCITLFVLVILVATAVYASDALTAQTAESDYLRIHVRANSNDPVDQEVKYKVRDAVVEFITPYAAQCVDKQTAMSVIGTVCDQIEDVCDRVLRENGFPYASHAEIRAEQFPTRVYGDLTLESGVYDALIIELGTGAGDNWWCVIYPPLCFTSGTADVKYRSVILEIIAKFFD